MTNFFAARYPQIPRFLAEDVGDVLVHNVHAFGVSCRTCARLEQFDT